MTKVQRWQRAEQRPELEANRGRSPRLPSLIKYQKAHSGRHRRPLISYAMTLTHIAGFHSLPLSLSQLNLPAVLKCGQSFRWTRIPLTSSGTAVPPSTPHLHPDCEWRLALQDRVICLRQNPTHIFYRSITPVVPVADADEDLVCLSFIRDYFQLDVDLLELYDDWSQKDPVFSGLRTRFSGIRMLRQDPWENLVS